MASPSKRIRYVNNVDYDCRDESSSDCESYDEYIPNRKVRSIVPVFNQTASSFNFQKTAAQRPGRKPKCFSKNALLARENRLKKKLHIAQIEKEVCSLRNENKKLSTIVDTQSHLITELRKEVKYLKSVIVNSKDISKLIRNINQSSGMSVSSSLDENLSLNNVCIPKLKQPVSRKVPHPWEDQKPLDDYFSSEPYFMPSPDQGLCEDFDNNFLDDINFNLPFDMPEDDFLDVSLDQEEKVGKPFEEHNYTLTKKIEDEAIDDVGVCLHVSKHHISLEFCASCSENANQSRST